MSKCHLFDLRDLDNPDLSAPTRVKYLFRLRTILQSIRDQLPDPERCRISEWGSAQANISLLLAEQGYPVVALDKNPAFLDYSRMKYEKGPLEWRSGDFSERQEAGAFDAVIFTETLEHCAYPEEILDNIRHSLKPGGILILTTPNGANPFFRLPTYHGVRKKKSREEFAARQFGEEGDDHLFLFTLTELIALVGERFSVLKAGYTGGTPFYNKIHPLFRRFPEKTAFRYLEVMSHLPIINRFSFSNIFLTARKK